MPYIVCQQARIYIVFTLSSAISYPSRNGTGFHRQRCRHIGFTDDFVTKRNNIFIQGFIKPGVSLPEEDIIVLHLFSLSLRA
jgi:hypothetical protein